MSGRLADPVCRAELKRLPYRDDSQLQLHAQDSSYQKPNSRPPRPELTRAYCGGNRDLYLSRNYTRTQGHTLREPYLRDLTDGERHNICEGNTYRATEQYVLHSVAMQVFLTTLPSFKKK